MVTYCNLTYHDDHLEIYRNIKSLCYVTGNKQTHRKEISFMATRDWGCGEGDLDEGS